MEDRSVAVILAMTSVEAAANEAYADGSPMFSPEQRADIEASRGRIDSLSVLEKLDHALSLKGMPLLEKGTSPIQDLHAPFLLINALVRFKPKRQGRPLAHRKLSRRLRGFMRPSGRFAGEDLSCRAWATSRNAFWAVDTAISLGGGRQARR